MRAFIFAALTALIPTLAVSQAVPTETVTLLNCVEQTGLVFTAMAYYPPPNGIMGAKTPPAQKDICRVDSPTWKIWENTTTTCEFKSGVKFRAKLGPARGDQDDNTTGRGSNDFHDNFDCWAEKKIGGCPGFRLGTADCDCVYACIRFIYD